MYSAVREASLQPSCGPPRSPAGKQSDVSARTCWTVNLFRTNCTQPMERHMTILKLAQRAVAAAAFVAAGSAFAANPALNLVSGSGTLAVDPSAAGQLTALSLSLIPCPARPPRQA